MTMPGFNPSQKIGHAMPAPLQVPAAGAPTSQPADQKPEKESFLHHVWDVINPFQHLPGVSTVYRAMTGEHIGTIERIAGDTLYGGLWGAVSSVADTVFEAVTGKDFADTVLALFSGKQDTAKTDSAAPVAQPAATPDSTAVNAGAAALSSAMQSKGVNSDLAQRAMYAYRQSMALPAAALAN